MWDIMNNEFEPVVNSHYGEFLNITGENIGQARSYFSDPSMLCICLNDSEKIKKEEYDYVKREVVDMLDKKYPEKSSFEK